MHALPVTDAHGDVVGGMVMSQDATADRQAEAVLRASEERNARSERMLKELVQSINAVVWSADAQTFALTFVSEQAEKLLGYPVSAGLESPTFWVEHLHPDDRDAAVDYCVDCTQRLMNHERLFRSCRKQR